ncbi:glycosyltransferase family 2 protein [Streptomyces sp. NPDC057592]|uniref:glycosyltransferase family 2 protein n=1 Tax=unclassified Streptomyces TaxID=2593676 RepID=UPI0036C394AB
MSVVVNTRNRPEHLNMVLKALSRQTGVTGGFEVIIVDDGSDCDLAPIVDGCSAADVRLIRQPPLGYTVARNAGLRAASGAVVLCLDDDVLFSDDLVSEHLRGHRRDGADVVVGDRFNTYMHRPFSDANQRAQDDALDGDWSGIKKLTRPDYYASRTFKVFDLDPGGLPAPWLCFVTRNVSFRRADALRVGAFDEGFTRWGVDDVELGLRLHLAGARYQYRPRAAVHHLETPIAPTKLEALTVSLDYFAQKHPGIEPIAFREFVFGRMALEELCASVRSRRIVTFDVRENLTWFRTQR